MTIIDNVTTIAKDDLTKIIARGDHLSIAAACFSIYAYQELKKQLEGVEDLRFIFTSDAFTTEHAPKEKREFYIPRLDRERNLYGSEFELKLRNELSQKAIAKECAAWIRRKVQFRSNVSGENMNSFLTIKNEKTVHTYQPLNGFTTVDIGCSRGNNASNIILRIDSEETDQFLQTFDAIWNDPGRLQDVTNVVLDNITAAYRENSPEYIYFVALYNIFHEFLDDISEDVLPNEATGFKSSAIWNMLYNFQKDAALAIINKLEKYNGCILADSVGLGKTFTALAVIKYYESRNRTVLVLCPKKLSNNWMTYRDNYVNNPVAADRLNYDVLYHTDLSRERGESCGLDLSRLNWGNYDLVVIDESHNFRNGMGTHRGTQENRYERLMERVIRAGVKTKVLMLSATPVNNRFYDLRNQLALAYEGHSDQLDEVLNTSKSIDEVFKQAQRAFTAWSKLDEKERTTERLLRMLDFDFFEVLDSVTIARSRKHIQRYYDTTDIGTFPQRKKPISLRPCLTDLDDAINYEQIYETLMLFNLNIYTPTFFIHPSKLSKYVDVGKALNQQGREQGIRRLMSINLLKRLESSVYSFRVTVDRILAYITATIGVIDRHVAGTSDAFEGIEIDAPDDFDDDDQNDDLLAVGKKVRIDLNDMDYVSWRQKLQSDADNLELLSLMIRDITPDHDGKLQALLALVAQKIEHPFNDGNKKVLIFTAFADTADYLYRHVSAFIQRRFGLHTAMVTGSVDGKTTIACFHADMNSVLTCFSPISKGMDVLMPGCAAQIDVLIATDCISEGQNLQDCDYCVNYDIHWNPVRIIQRFGRIDRIGSRNAAIQLVNFWPDLNLDEYINLKSRVETRMKISVMASTGDDDLINAEEKGDLEYRKQQLKRLQEEVVDIEDMQTGISIMDLGLNEFRLDLLAFMQDH
ncbi:MAG: helicase-related protein, partial [Clostridia bacterium]